jgi:EAL domain-containing protein (putative c-di-GMP-specific phosphodiesterase class I)/GGDEF domain-containing protein
MCIYNRLLEFAWGFVQRMSEVGKSDSRSGVERDPVTGLITGNEIMLVIREHINRFNVVGGAPPQLAFLDIDRFGGLATILGEEGSRVLLRAYSSRLSEALGRDAMLARAGSDRFFVLFDEPEVIHRLRGLFDAPFEVNGHTVYAPTSIGVAVYPRDADGPHQLVRCASMAMKWAKRLTPGGLMEFESQMREDASRARLLEDSMRNVADNPSTEFKLLYQPKIDLKTKRVVGVEALMRWHNPLLGAVSPDEFIPVAEATRLIVPLGRWLIDSSFAVMKDWRERGYDLTMAINVSPVELETNDFIENLVERSKFYEVPPEMVELEITDRLVVSDYAVGQLLDIRELGYNIAIDDFGRDQSNLTRIASLPVTTLKIDKSLTDDLLENRRQFILIKNIISLAADLGLKSVIEGVETNAQASQLADLGGDFSQGFYMSPAVSPEAVIKIKEDSELN